MADRSRPPRAGQGRIARNTAIFSIATGLSRFAGMGREVVAAVTNGKLDFGPWEQIFYGEFDGQRRKRVLIKIIGE